MLNHAFLKGTNNKENFQNNLVLEIGHTLTIGFGLITIRL